MGGLIIPKLDATLPIFHGTNEDEMKKVLVTLLEVYYLVKMIIVFLAGHCDIVFRKLGEVGVDDELIVIADAGTFTYKVSEVRNVEVMIEQ